MPAMVGVPTVVNPQGNGRSTAPTDPQPPRGQGTVVGTLLGVFILALLANGVNVFNVPIEIQYILIGVIIIANTALGQWRRKG